MARKRRRRRKKQKTASDRLLLLLSKRLRALIHKKGLEEGKSVYRGTHTDLFKRVVRKDPAAAVKEIAGWIAWYVRDDDRRKYGIGWEQMKVIGEADFGDCARAFYNRNRRVIAELKLIGVKDD